MFRSLLFAQKQAVHEHCRPQGVLCHARYDSPDVVAAPVDIADGLCESGGRDRQQPLAQRRG